MAVAVKFENVSKRFTLHHQRTRSFQEVFVNLFRWNGSKETFWALKDVSFEVQRGETVGIIGRNGSGKSTILKLIGRILEPTSESVTVNGKVSALLELGAGFHPDLTGKENIYLNGSLLGFSKKEMDRKYDEIVEFSELQRFIDTPVKHYSSGMYMRLGFSIAVAVDPDILVADEVLAVGDQLFQRKCLERMQEFKKTGRTVILVSHDMEAVRNFCDRTVWMERGQVRRQGVTAKIVDEYVMEMGGVGSRVSSNRSLSEPAPVIEVESSVSRWGSKEAEIVGVEFCDLEGGPTEFFETAGSLLIRIRFVAHQRIDRPVFGLAIYREDGTHVCGPNTKTSGMEIEAIEGVGSIEYEVEDLPLLEGKYALTVAIYDWSCLHPYDHHERLYPFRVVSKITQERYGTVLLRSSWRMNELASAAPHP